MFCALFFHYGANAQNTQIPISNNDKATINVFLDCRGCDDDFIITETRFVSFVRDQDLADLHLLVIRQRTFNGAQYLIDYIDQRTLEKPKKYHKILPNTIKIPLNTLDIPIWGPSI